VVLHRYEFSRNDQKFYLLERNRLMLVLTLLEARTLGVLAPALLGLELAIFVVALRQGWWRQKVAGWRWLLQHRSMLRQRRREVQAARVAGDRELAGLLTGDFSPGESTGLAVPPVARTISRLYWRLGRTLLRREH
jgi:hypothetical protein